jgi:hypothetical protein
MTDTIGTLDARCARGSARGGRRQARLWICLAALLAAGCGRGAESGELDPGSTKDAGPLTRADAGASSPDRDSGGLNPERDAGGLDPERDGGSVEADAGPAADAGLDEDAGAPDAPEPSWEELQLESARMALDGIIRYVGAHYQSCAPLLNLDQTPSQALVDHFGLPASHTVDGHCVDRRDADFRYLSFLTSFEDLSAVDGEYSLDPAAGRMALVDGELDSFRRVHCTGALTGTIAAGDMKFHVGQTDKSYSPNTTELEELIQEGDHCFVSPTMTKSFSLLPGDIINVSAGHAVRVFRVGADPLGLGRVQTVEDCEGIRKRDLDFHFVHSSSNDVYSGVHFLHTSDPEAPSLIRTLVTAVRQMCRESFDDGDIRGEIPHLYLGNREFMNGLIVRERHFRVLRHVGPRVAECAWQPGVPVRGDGCLQQSCFVQVVAAGAFP